MNKKISELELLENYSAKETILPVVRTRDNSNFVIGAEKLLKPGVFFLREADLSYEEDSDTFSVYKDLGSDSGLCLTPEDRIVISSFSEENQYLRKGDILEVEESESKDSVTVNLRKTKVNLLDLEKDSRSFKNGGFTGIVSGDNGELIFEEQNKNAFKTGDYIFLNEENTVGDKIYEAGSIFKILEYKEEKGFTIEHIENLSLAKSEDEQEPQEPRKRVHIIYPAIDLTGMPGNYKIKNPTQDGDNVLQGDKVILLSEGSGFLHGDVLNVLHSDDGEKTFKIEKIGNIEPEPGHEFHLLFFNFSLPLSLYPNGDMNLRGYFEVAVLEKINYPIDSSYVLKTLISQGKVSVSMPCPAVGWVYNINFHSDVLGDGILTQVSFDENINSIYFDYITKDGIQRYSHDLNNGEDIQFIDNKK